MEAELQGILMGAAPPASLAGRPLFAALLLLGLLLVFWPRVLRVGQMTHGDDWDRLRRRLAWLIPLTGGGMGFLVFSAFSGQAPGIVSDPAGQSDLFTLFWWRVSPFFGGQAPLAAGILAAILFSITLVATALAAYALFWRRRTAGLVLLAYAVLRLVSIRPEAVFGALVGDLALAACVLLLMHEAMDSQSTFRIWLAAPVGLAAVFADPACISLIIFYFSYLGLEAIDRGRSFGRPAVWLSALAILLFSLPLFSTALTNIGLSSSDLEWRQAHESPPLAVLIPLALGLILLLFGRKESRKPRFLLLLWIAATGIVAGCCFPTYSLDLAAKPLFLPAMALGAGLSERWPVKTDDT